MGFIMYRNYLLIWFRTMAKDVRYLLIATSSLAFGLVVAINSFLYVHNELSIEKSHVSVDRIFRIGCSTLMDNTSTQWAPAPAPLAQALSDEFPEIESITRIAKAYANGRGINVRLNDKVIEQDQFLMADSTFFSIFTYQFLFGDAKALTHPGQIVITEELYSKLFPDSGQNPIGETISVGESELAIAGVVKNNPYNSHISFNGLISWTTFDRSESWTDAYAYTYILLHDANDIEKIKDAIPSFIARQIDGHVKSLESKVDLIIQPLKDIHLSSNLNDELNTNGNILYVYLFIILGIFILIISITNYVNISLAKSRRRAKEIGVRKVMGAQKTQVQGNLLFESLLLTLLATVLGLLLTFLLLPVFSQILNETLNMEMLFRPFFVVFILALIVIVTLLSGSYPAFYIATFNPIDILKGTQGKDRSFSVRKVLVMIQLVVSVTMIIMTFLVSRQLHFVNTRELGFVKENLFVIRSQEDIDLEALKDDLLSHNEVITASLTSFTPEDAAKDEFKIEVDGVDRVRVVEYVFGDHNFVKLMQMKIIDGRDFDENIDLNPDGSYLVNEEAVKTFGWKEPIGKRIGELHGDGKGTVIGVVRNANLFSLHEKIQPLVIRLIRGNVDQMKLLVRSQPSKQKQALLLIEEKYHEMIDAPAATELLADHYSRLYRSERDMGSLVNVATLLVIIISGLGLYGLSSLLAEQKSKEGCIRKIMGATRTNVFFWYIKGFLNMSAIANLLSWPIAYFLLIKWLETFSYKINIGPSVFILAGLVTLGIVLLTTGYHAMAMTRVDPATTLRQN